MTSEILIMNKNCVALAADSAATLDNRKIYEANKIFALSKEFPVGVMLYQNPNISNVPLETIIKQYRKSRHDSKEFSDVEDYANDFLDFIDKQSKIGLSRASLISKDSTDSYLRQSIYMLWEDIFEEVQRDMIDELFEKAEGRVPSIDINMDARIKEKLQARLDWILSTCRDSNLKKMESTKKCLMKTVFESEKSEHIQEVLNNYMIPAMPYVDTLIDILSAMINSEEPFDETTGLIIAGFGKNQTYPSYIEYNVDGYFFNKLKCKEIIKEQVNEGDRGIIKTFAQKDVSDTFLNGIDPDLMDALFENFCKILDRTTLKIAENSINDGKFSKENVLSANKYIMDDFYNVLNSRIYCDYFRPIKQSLEFLSKTEMAQMAASLVNLTSLRRRVSLNDVESVGGPVDVAMISKGDGLVWINRKHYFNMELNPHYDGKR